MKNGRGHTNRAVASHAEVIKIYEELKTVVKKTGDTTCAYTSGSGDAAVAAKLGVGVQSVVSIRRTNFGTFHERGDTPPGQTPVAALGNALEQLRIEHENKLVMLGLSVDHLSGRLTDIAQRMDKLLTTLSLSKVVDVRHLKTSND